MFRLVGMLTELINVLAHSFKLGHFISYVQFLLGVLVDNSARRQLPEPLIGLRHSSSLRDSVCRYDVELKNNFLDGNYLFYVTLAGVRHRLNTEQLWVIDWEDIEEHFALHRFGWLLVEMPKGQIEHSCASFIIYDWINKHGVDNSETNWDSYSISERVSNWIVLFERYPEIFDVHAELVKQSICRQLYYLDEHLEFRGNATNNHLINNGRALYLGGVFLEDGFLSEKGRKILLSCSGYMFSKSGFLREGSSHYQILLARTYLEVMYIARKENDYQFFDILRVPVHKIWMAACFFLSEEVMPQFGDMSPDFSPGFHDGVQQVGAYLFNEYSDKLSNQSENIDDPGWHHYFKISSCVLSEKGTAGLSYYEDAGYFCFKNSSFSLYTYLNPEGFVPAWSHGHADIGHIIIYVKGEPVLVGTGRVNYSNNFDGLKGRSIKSHNAIEVDGNEPCVVHGLNFFEELLPEWYSIKPPELKIIKNDNDNCEILIKQYGYQRFSTEVYIERRIIISVNEIKIVDYIKGRGVNRLKSRFHFSPSVSLDGSNDESWVIYNDDFRLIFESNNIDRAMVNVGSISPAYGVNTISDCIVFDQKNKLPVINEYNFRLST